MEIILDVLIIVSSFIVLLGVIIGFHELGHFLAARYFGIHVIRFKIGFGKAFLKRFDNKVLNFPLEFYP